MIFCGQCGYQLSPGETICPRCGAATDADQLENDPGSNKPTEISHILLDAPPLRNRSSQPRLPIQQQRLPEQQPLVLGSNPYNGQLANETTSMMNSQPAYPQQQSYTNYPQQQAGTGFYGYNTGSYPQPQGNQAMAQILEASRRGKTGALLLILFGLLLLTGAVVILLLTFQGLIFTA